VRGTYGRPIINFPSYDGYGAFEVDVVTAASEGFYQQDLDISSFAELRLYFTARTDRPDDDVADSIRVELFDNEVTLFESTLSIGPNFSDFDLIVPLGVDGAADASCATLVFFYSSDAGTLWFDNIGLYGTSDGVALLPNSSAESGGTSPWLYATGGANQGTVRASKISGKFREREEYKLQLQVVDSRGGSSAVEEIDVLGTPCLAPF
jgi:hypothetical protein